MCTYLVACTQRELEREHQEDARERMRQAEAEEERRRAVSETGSNVRFTCAHVHGLVHQAPTLTDKAHLTADCSTFERPPCCGHPVFLLRVSLLFDTGAGAANQCIDNPFDTPPPPHPPHMYVSTLFAILVLAHRYCTRWRSTGCDTEHPRPRKGALGCRGGSESRRAPTCRRAGGS